MHRCTLRHIVLAICTLFAPYLAVASEHPQDDAVRVAEQRLFAGSDAPGMVIAVVDGNSMSIHGYDETRPGSKTPPDAHSLLRTAGDAYHRPAGECTGFHAGANGLASSPALSKRT